MESLVQGKNTSILRTVLKISRTLNFQSDQCLLGSRRGSLLYCNLPQRGTQDAFASLLGKLVLPCIHTCILYYHQNRMAAWAWEAFGVTLLHHGRWERDQQWTVYPQRLHCIAVLHPEQSDQRGLRQRVGQHRHREDLLYMCHAYWRYTEHTQWSNSFELLQPWFLNNSWKGYRCIKGIFTSLTNSSCHQHPLNIKFLPSSMAYGILKILYTLN